MKGGRERERKKGGSEGRGGEDKQFSWVGSKVEDSEGTRIALFANSLGAAETGATAWEWLRLVQVLTGVQ